MERVPRAELLRASPPLFESRALDRLTRVHPVVPPILFLPAITLTAILAFQRLPAAHALLGIAAVYFLAVRTTGTAAASMDVDSRLTFYTRYGDVFAGLCIMISFLLAIWAIAFRAKRSRSFVS